MTLPKPQPAPADMLLLMTKQLAAVEKHLNSIRSALNFFVVVLILSIILQACSTLMSL